MFITRNSNGDIISLQDKRKSANDVYIGNHYTLNAAEEQAKELSDFTKETYIAIDRGDYITPKYDTIRIPHIGDEVIYTFNGDYYPCGQITKVSKDFKKVTTSTGKVFYRKKQSGQWIMKGGTWKLVQGHINQKNPSF